MYRYIVCMNANGKYFLKGARMIVNTFKVLGCRLQFNLDITDYFTFDQKFLFFMHVLFCYFLLLYILSEKIIVSYFVDLNFNGKETLIIYIFSSK